MINKTISNKIIEEREISIKLRELSFDLDDLDKATKIREEQTKHYYKMQFYKNLLLALEKQQKKDFESKRRGI